MPQDKKSLDPGMVSSIFEDQPRKKVSGLFEKGDDALREKRSPAEQDETIFRKKFPFGLDIGSNAVKIVRLGQDKKGLIRVCDLIAEDLPDKVREDPEERNKILPELVKKLVNKYGLKRDCFTAIPSSSVKIDLIKLPVMPADEIEKALEWEIKQTLHADMNETAAEHIILSRQNETFLRDKIGVLVVTVPRKDVLEHLRVLGSAGLNVMAVDIRPLADLAALEHWKGNKIKDDVILFLDFDADKTYLNIICNGELISTRTLNVTGNYLTSTISEYCGISWNEAEEMKKAYGFGIPEDPYASSQLEEKSGQIRNALLPLLEDMVRNIEHTFKYFSYQVTQSNIVRFNRVVLSGGSSCLKGLGPYFRSRLDVDAEIIDPLKAFGGDGYNMKETCMGPRLNVALGLALRGVET